MATVTEKLQELKDTKTRLKTAIESKGQDLTDVPFTQYADKVAEIKPNVISKEIVENGTYNAEDDGVEGYSSVNVNVPVPDLSEATATTDDIFEGKVAFGQEGKLVGTYKDMMQRKVDSSKSCYDLFYSMPDEDLSWVNKLDTSKVETMEQMFYNCTKLIGLELKIDTKNVNSMRRMFYSCYNMLNLDLKSLNTSNVTTMTGMFYQCSKLKNLDLSNFNTSKLTSVTDMFAFCYELEELDLTSFDVSNVTSLNSMFLNCSSMHTLKVDRWNTDNVTNMYNTFNGCNILPIINLNGWNTNKVTNMSQTFSSCKETETIIGTLDMISVTNTSQMFYYCKKLKNVTLKNIKKSLTFGTGDGSMVWDYGTLLSNETLINTIKELWDLTGGTSQKLTLSTASKNNIANIYVKLIDVTDEMRTEDEYIDNKKPCVVCESTDTGAMTLTEYAISKNWAIA